MLKAKNKGFIETTTLFIVVGVLIGLLGIGFIGIKQYQNQESRDFEQEQITIEPQSPTNENTEIEKLRQEIENLKKQSEEDKKSNTVVNNKITVENNSIKPNQTILTPPPAPKSIKTFTTPSGAVIDEAGNIISPPTGNTIVPTQSQINPGEKILTSVEVYSLISPSIVLITTPEAQGTGFVINGGKYTLTNSHVVGNYKKVTLRFNTGGSYQGEVLGVNDSADLAIIFNGEYRPPAVIFGKSDGISLRVGSDVFAFGFPLGFTETITLTKGIISASRQQIGSASFIQTDATIHPGNSGGPLSNNKGEIIGINTRGVVAQGNIENVGGTGIGFAIPIETAVTLIPSLSQYGKSRIELYPIGSVIDIKKNMQLNIVLNSPATCEYLAYKGSDLTLCNLYRNYREDYNWNIIE